MKFGVCVHELLGKKMSKLNIIYDIYITYFNIYIYIQSYNHSIIYKFYKFRFFLFPPFWTSLWATSSKKLPSAASTTGRSVELSHSSQAAVKRKPGRCVEMGMVQLYSYSYMIIVQLENH